jgi:hypothetical protein
MFWMTVGQARRQTADAIGPSTIERSNVRDAEEVADGWMTDSIAFPQPRAASHAREAGDRLAGQRVPNLP